MFMGFAKSYSLKTWVNGLNWSAYFQVSSKSVTLGFVIPPVVVSKTPSVCTVTERVIKFIAPGECILNGSAPGDNTWLPTIVATAKFMVTA
jgi:hypothetical protein